MSDSDSDISDESFFCPWECMHSDSDSIETIDYEETSTDESSIDTHNTDEKDVFISIYDRNKNDYLTLISSSNEIKNYRRSYSQLSQKSDKNIEKIWDDILLYNQMIGQISMKNYKYYINEYLNKNRDKKSNQNINKNIQININDTKKSVIVKNSCECQQPKIQPNHVKEVPKILSKKAESKSQAIVNDKNQNSMQNMKSCPTKDKESNMNLINKEQNINNNITDKKEKSTPINKKVIQNDSKNYKIKPTENNTEKKNSDSKSNINQFKQPIDKVPQPISNNTPIKAKIIDKNNNSGDANQINGTNNINIVKLDTGSSKKKIKKQKQKEKKLENCKRDTSNSSSKEVSESPTKKTMNSKNNIKIEKINNIKIENKQSKDKDKKSVNGKAKKNSKVQDSSQESDIDDSKATDISTSDDNMEFLTDSENIPTFFTEVVKRKVKGKNKTTKTIETIKNIDKKGDFVKPNKEDFILHTRKREPYQQNKSLPILGKEDMVYSDKFAEKAVDMVLENKLMGALQFLVEALAFNPTDHRHYLNRCYCYLRIGRYPLALEDARYVIHTSINVGYVFIANLRAGQAAFAGEDYELAEEYLKEATYINLENHHAQRELLRVKVTRIVSMGFKKKDALLALKIYPSTLDAIEYLTGKNNTSVNNSLSDNFDFIYDNYDNLVYSSDEDEKPSNIEIANRILHYDPGKIKLTHIVAKPSNANLISSLSVGKNISNKNNNVEKKVTLNSKLASKQTTEKAIWVGSLTNSITDAMLKKNFKKIGNVISIYRPVNEAYAFVNFDKNEDVAKALACPSSHEIAGVKLQVRAAVRQK